MRQRPEKLKNQQSTLLEMQAAINREMSAPIDGDAGVFAILGRLRDREMLLRQTFQKMLEEQLVQVTAKNRMASYQPLPGFQKLRKMFQEDNAPEQIDVAFMHALRTTFSRMAVTEYQNTGRGALVIDLTQGQESDVTPKWHVGGGTDPKISTVVANYDPMVEFVAAVVRPGDDVRVYRVNLARIGGSSYNTNTNTQADTQADTW